MNALLLTYSEVGAETNTNPRLFFGVLIWPGELLPDPGYPLEHYLEPIQLPPTDRTTRNNDCLKMPPIKSKVLWFSRFLGHSRYVFDPDEVEKHKIQSLLSYVSAKGNARVSLAKLEKRLGKRVSFKGDIILFLSLDNPK